MLVNHYQKYNNLLGWIAFAIALITYTLTLEPTVSYWDCGEYIATSVKLEVGHPPGAPLFQMMGAFFAMFTNDALQIAKMVNFMSALASAFTILFLFWTITAIAKKMVLKYNENISDGHVMAILGSGLVGALAYTFSDSFWFSAVEAEVYAMSSFLMALLFWLGLRWETEMDNPGGHKWLLLISFVVGLSFGVHILSLLVIPAIVFMYINKKTEHFNWKSFILANVISVGILALVFKFLFPFSLVYFSALELFFVNTVGLPFNSGSIIASIILAGLFFFGLKQTRKKNKPIANLAILCTLFIMIGFSSWLMLPIRANANTTINENNPSSARELLAYYNREQYGDANVFYGSYFSENGADRDKSDPYRDAKPKYEKDEKQGKYVIVNNYKDAVPNYSDKHKGIIPRMVDPSPGVVQNYKAITGIPQKSNRRPTFGENIYFMIDYQFGYMYARYFMWNFVGKQDDIQGNLDNHGNWMSGINFIDEIRLGSQKDLPADVLENKGRNKYYFLPFILGLIGLFYQLKNDKRDFYALFLFFAFTGLAIIFYTNPKPFEPRERDYAVVGSFYVFAMWIGFGVLALYDQFKGKMNPKVLALTITGLSLLAVPTLMAKENWDDHDRSGRYSTRNNAKAYLDSCQENAIMFTIGDNDTFPLWYMQEVEDYRTDIKLVNTSLFAKDWYIDQQKRKTYKAPPIPSQLSHDDYKEGSLDVAYHYPYPFPQFKDSIMDIQSFMKWIQSKDMRTMVDFEENGHPEKVYPTNKLRLMVDKDAVLKNGIVPMKDADLIVPYIDITIADVLTKNRILMLDVLANNNWTRPLYFTGGAQAAEEYIWLKDYLQLDGLAYRFVPIKTPLEGANFMNMGRIDTETMYNNVQKWDWRNSNGDIYLDPETRKNAISFRNSLGRLADELILEGDFAKAEEILDLAMDKMPIDRYGYYRLVIGYIESYYNIDKRDKARFISEFLIGNIQETLNYYGAMSSDEISANFSELEGNLDLYRYIIATTQEFDSEEYTAKLKEEFMASVSMLEKVLEE